MSGLSDTHVDSFDARYASDLSGQPSLDGHHATCHVRSAHNRFSANGIQRHGCFTEFLFGDPSHVRDLHVLDVTNDPEGKRNLRAFLSRMLTNRLTLFSSASSV
jgi:hypothetical protein